MDIYIKPTKKASLANRNFIRVEDISEVVTNKEDITRKVKSLQITRIKEQKKCNMLVAVSDIVSVIVKEYPDASIINLGEPDTLIDYLPQKTKDRKWLEWLKITFVIVVLLTGSLTAIMSFYSDAQMSQIFDKVYSILFGVSSAHPLIIEIPYCLGLTFGIVVFYNHAFGKKIDGDPTPIEVQMSLYEADTTDTLIDALNSKRTHGGSGND